MNVLTKTEQDMCPCAHVRMWAWVSGAMGTWAHVRMVTCIAILLACSSAAQTVGKLRLMVDPGNNFQFVLDHKYRMQQREVELSTGPHHFSIWAPQRMVVDTTLIVLPDQSRDVFIRLPFSSEYGAYEQELRGMAHAGDIELRQTVTRASDADWAGPRGRLKREALAELVHDPATLCFVCGPPALVDEMPRLLAELGVPRERIRIEEW